MSRRYHRAPLCSIYRAVNTINGKVYVGQTWKPMKIRWWEHQGHPTCRKFHAAIHKYGAKSFRVELLTFAGTQETANTLEAYFIERYDSIRSGYNIREAGAAGRLSEETKRLMSNAQRGKVVSEETRAKLRAANLGKKRSPQSAEVRAKISAALTGKSSLKNGNYVSQQLTWEKVTHQRRGPK